MYCNTREEIYRMNGSTDRLERHINQCFTCQERVKAQFVTATQLLTLFNNAGKLYRRLPKDSNFLMLKGIEEYGEMIGAQLKNGKPDIYEIADVFHTLIQYLMSERIDVESLLNASNYKTDQVLKKYYYSEDI